MQHWHSTGSTSTSFTPRTTCFTQLQLEVPQDLGLSGRRLPSSSILRRASYACSPVPSRPSLKIRRISPPPGLHLDVASSTSLSTRAHAASYPAPQLPTQTAMFSKLLTVFAVATAAAAWATTTTAPPPVTTPSSPQCCDSVVSSTSEAASLVAALVGLDLTGLDIPVGLSCSPITVIGNNCGGTTVTCDAPDAEWDNLIAINCIPITL
uniref:Hydrophobin n=1 Tax=Mycena chlorophos TaxID=658473 RepID=A0ABQ0LET1_MYCCL|nr:hydrophobin [Mycena chlorophos]